jgi:RNA polymerase sigma-70 factor (ECF subfamily)
MLTVRRRPEEWLRGFSAGANDYLSKPFDPKGLVERVENGLSGQTLRLASAGTPEFQLIQAAAGGNRAAFEILIQKYRDRLIEAIRPTARAGVDVEDVVANAFLIAFESLKDFRGEAAFYTWLYRIAANENLLVQRKTNELSIEELTKGDEAVLPRALAQEDATDHRLAHHEERDRLLQILEEVPELYREILSMYFVREMSYEAISETLQLPLGTVMSRLFKARTLLKKSWGREDRAEARRALLS